MSHPKLDRSRLRIRRLECRPSKVEIVRDAVSPETKPRPLSAAASEALAECVGKICAARLAGRPVILVFGAHTIKNGLAPVLIELIEKGWGTLTNHHMVIVDLAESSWNWQQDGEPPADTPAYYLRYCKTFSRMGGSMRYVSAHNRDFLLTLLHDLKS